MTNICARKRNKVDGEKIAVDRRAGDVVYPLYYTLVGLDNWLVCSSNAYWQGVYRFKLYNQFSCRQGKTIG